MENTGVRLWEILDKMLYAIFVRFLHLKFFRKTLGWIYAVRQVRSSRSHGIRSFPIL